MATEEIQSSGKGGLSSREIFANQINSETNIPQGLPNSGGGTFGQMGGDISKDALGIGSEGIDLGLPNLDGVLALGNAFESNPFSALFDGTLSPFGLVKSECFAIKSLGILASLNSLSIAKNFKGLEGNTSIVGRGGA